MNRVAMSKYAVFETANNIFAILYRGKDVADLLVYRAWPAGNCKLIAIVSAQNADDALVEFGKIVVDRFLGLVGNEPRDVPVEPNDEIVTADEIGRMWQRSVDTAIKKAYGVRAVAAAMLGISERKLWGYLKKDNVWIDGGKGGGGTIRLRRADDDEAGK